MTTPPKASIYTKTGDNGTTKLVGGSSVEKYSLRVETYGTIDELNSYLGLCRSTLIEQPSLLSIDPLIEKIQNELFNMGSLFACDKADLLTQLPEVNETHFEYLEKKIDEFSQDLPELRAFILPGGSLVSSHLHVARGLCRRAERRASRLQSQFPHYQNSMIYLNRLSDLLFVLARWCNFKQKISDVQWKKNP